MPAKKEEKKMLRREENPGLFDAIKDAYNEQIKDIPNAQKIKDSAQEIDDEKLSSIKEVLVWYYYDLKELNGVEKLTNLESFGVIGPRENELKDLRDILIENAKKSASQTNQNINYKPIENRLLLEYEKNQITDFSPLKKCPNLNKLYVYNQREIKSINLANWKKLKEIAIANCPRLEMIDGLDELQIKKEDEISFVVRNCDRLKFFPGIVELASKVEKSSKKSVVEFPIKSYFLMTNCDKSLRKDKILQNSTKVEWADEYYSYKTVQAELAKTRVEEILGTVCDRKEDLLGQLASAYRWICDNVTYDQELANLEDKLNKVDCVELDDMKRHLAGDMRSVLTAMWKKKVVCTAMADVLDLFCAVLGIYAQRVDCIVDMDKALSEPLNYDFVHSMTKVLLNIKGKEYYYYLDPTSDLYREEFHNKDSRFFCLNHKEASKYRAFGIKEMNCGGGPSLQTYFAKRGLLVTREKPSSLIDNIKQKHIVKRKTALIKKNVKMGLPNPIEQFGQEEKEM